MCVLDRKELRVSSSESRISFPTQGGGAWPVWDRYLAVDGKRAYHLGNICQTCQFLFQRLEGANTSVQIEGTAEALKVGVGALRELIVEQVEAGLPEGDYIVTLADVKLEQTRPGEQNDYFVKEQIALMGQTRFGICRMTLVCRTTGQGSARSATHRRCFSLLFQCSLRAGLSRRSLLRIQAH